MSPRDVREGEAAVGPGRVRRRGRGIRNAPLGREEGTYLNLDDQSGNPAFASGVPAQEDAHDEWTREPVQIVLAQKYPLQAQTAQGERDRTPASTARQDPPGSRPVTLPRNNAQACQSDAPRGPGRP